MYTILLIIPDNNLRQLYHELLFSGMIEVVPAHDLGGALLMLSLAEYSTAVLYVDEQSSAEIKTFLNVRKENLNLLKTKIILLTDQVDFFAKSLTENDMILDPNRLTPEFLALHIKKKIQSSP